MLMCNNKEGLDEDSSRQTVLYPVYQKDDHKEVCTHNAKLLSIFPSSLMHWVICKILSSNSTSHQS